MSDLKKYDFTRTKAVLAEIRNVLRCPICQEVAANPYSLGHCSHFFCAGCVSSHSGGDCPAPGCRAAAPARDKHHNKAIHSFTNSVLSIGAFLGEQVPEKLKKHMSVAEDDEDTAVPSSSGVTGEEPYTDTGETEMKRRAQDRKEATTGDSSKPTNENEAPETQARSRRTKSLKKEAEADTIETNKFKSPEPRPSRRSKTTLPSEKSTETKRPKAGPSNRSRSVTPENRPKKRSSSGSVSSTRKKPASLEKKNRKGESSLHSAAVKGDLETVQQLLEQGANPNTVDNAGWSPLHEASVAGRADIVKVLLEHGASPNLPAAEENLTPLHDAASGGHVDVVRLLVARGADTRARNSQGLTPRDVAKSPEVMSALEQTTVEITPSQALNQSVVQQDVLEPESIVVSCPETTDVEFKKICQAAAKLKIRKPSRAVSEKTTLCILDSFRKPVSVLAAQLIGADLVQSEWILQSKMIGQVVDTEPFLLQSPDLTQEGRRRSRDCRIRGQPRLFTGLHFYLTGGFDQPNLSKAELQKIISLSGAKLVHREPNPENLPPGEKTVPFYAEEGSALSRTSHVILYQEGGKREPLVKYKMEHVKTLPLTWFLQSILQHTLLEPQLFLQ